MGLERERHNKVQRVPLGLDSGSVDRQVPLSFGLLFILYSFLVKFEIMRTNYSITEEDIPKVLALVCDSVQEDGADRPLEIVLVLMAPEPEGYQDQYNVTTTMTAPINSDCLWTWIPNPSLG